MQPNNRGGETLQNATEINVVMTSLKSLSLLEFAASLSDSVDTANAKFLRRHPDVLERQTQRPFLEEVSQTEEFGPALAVRFLARLAICEGTFADNLTRISDNLKGIKDEDTLDLDPQAAYMCMRSIEGVLKDKNTVLAPSDQKLGKQMVKQYKKDTGQLWYQKFRKK